jgi:hypothetical protein
MLIGLPVRSPQASPVLNTTVELNGTTVLPGRAPTAASCDAIIRNASGTTQTDMFLDMEKSITQSNVDQFGFRRDVSSRRTAALKIGTLPEP